MNGLGKLRAAAFLASVLAGSAGASAADTADRIRYDAQCFTINGHDTLIYSGAFHYFRCPKELWPARLQSMKSAGLNTIETYVAWDWHERTPPTDVNDMSKLDMTDLHDFLDLAINQFGFNVIIRPGPYICAEWDGGGYPQWLRLKKPAGYKDMWYRGDDPTYLAWCRHWFNAVAQTVAPFQITHQPTGKPGVILWQIENEYTFDSDHSAAAKLRQLQALAHDSRDADIDVPLFTCLTENPLFRADPYLKANVIETHNSYPTFDMKGFLENIDALRPYQPDKPLMMTELQGGWFSQVGGDLSSAKGFNAAQITQITMLAWAHGYTSTNYYMMFGGTNFGDWAAANITTSYDYAAPIRECGGVDERYQAVASMAHMIQQIGPKLVRATPEKSHVDGDAPAGVTAVIRKAKDGTRFVFVFNGSQKESAMGTLKLVLDDTPNAVLSVDVDLKPFDAKVLVLPARELETSKGEWLPKILPLPQRPKVLPAEIEIEKVLRQADPGPSEWKPVTGDHSEEAAGIFDRRFVYYRVKVPEKLPFSHTAIRCKSRVAGTIMQAGHYDDEKSEGGPVSSGTSVELPLEQRDENNNCYLIYMNNGRPNGGPLMEAPGGITEMSLVNADAAALSFGSWRLHRLVKGETASQDIVDDGDVAKWQNFKPGNATELTANESAVYRCNFDLTPNDLEKRKSILQIGRIDDRGTVYVNGKQVAECKSWDQPVKVDVEHSLHVGKNTIVVIVHNDASLGGLGLGVSLNTARGGSDSAVPLEYEVGIQCVGDAQKWYAPEFDDSNWRVSLLHPSPEAENHGGSLDGARHVGWYRLHFKLPPVTKQAWVPLKLRLTIQNGDGFLYLNGHPLGRWWQQGPQTDYYLPECWLHRDSDNVAVVSLTGTQHPDTNGSPPPDGVVDARILPYDDLSEVRP